MFLDSEYVVKPDKEKSNQCHVDFWVPEAGWAIEFLCGGNARALEEHLDSFAPGGKYDGEDVKKWKVVEFLWGGEKRPDEQYLIYNPNLIVLDFTEVQKKLENNPEFTDEEEYFVEWICGNWSEKIELKGHKLFRSTRR